jgi:hypothetical protein
MSTIFTSIQQVGHDGISMEVKQQVTPMVLVNGKRIEGLSPSSEEALANFLYIYATQPTSQLLDRILTGWPAIGQKTREDKVEISLLPGLIQRRVKVYLQHGLLQSPSSGQPAVFVEGIHMLWYKNGVAHNDKGPAIVDLKNPTLFQPAFALDGKFLSVSEWASIVFC